MLDRLFFRPFEYFEIILLESSDEAVHRIGDGDRDEYEIDIPGNRAGVRLQRGIDVGVSAAAWRHDSVSCRFGRSGSGSTVNVLSGLSSGLSDDKRGKENSQEENAGSPDSAI